MASRGTYPSVRLTATFTPRSDPAFPSPSYLNVAASGPTTVLKKSYTIVIRGTDVRNRAYTLLAP